MLLVRRDILAGRLLAGSQDHKVRAWWDLAQPWEGRMRPTLAGLPVCVAGKILCAVALLSLGWQWPGSEAARAGVVGLLRLTPVEAGVDKVLSR